MTSAALLNTAVGTVYFRITLGCNDFGKYFANCGLTCKILQLKPSGAIYIAAVTKVLRGEALIKLF